MAENECRAFDFVVGNPPWIAWDNLPDDYRQATKPLWQRYGLFSLSGNEARHGGGKKDLSMLMLYAAADRYLKPGGRLGMVITQTLFQTKGAGDGFRRFRLGADGLPLRVLRVDDMVALRPFDDAANWTSTIVLEKGAAHGISRAVLKWTEREAKAEGGRRKRENAGPGLMLDVCASRLPHVLHVCIPSSPFSHSSFRIHHFSPGRSIRRRPNFAVAGAPQKEPEAQPTDCCRADYTAHLGANSGGANGVYWVEVLGQSIACGALAPLSQHGGQGQTPHRYRRAGDRARLALSAACAGPTSDASRPCRSGILLLAQDPATRTGIDEARMRAAISRARWPIWSNSASC